MIQYSSFWKEPIVSKKIAWRWGPLDWMNGVGEMGAEKCS